MNHIEHLAANVVEVDGVEGLFIMDPKGATIATMLPAYYDGLDGNVLRRRIYAFLQSFEETVFGAKESILDFGDKVLHLSRSPSCIIGVIAHAETNLGGVQVAARLMMKKVRVDDIQEMERAAETDSDDDGVAARVSSPGLDKPSSTQPSKPRTPPPFRSTGEPSEPKQDGSPPKKNRQKKSNDDNFKGIWG